MSKYPLVDFKAIKAAVSMEQVLRHYGLLDQFKRSKENLSGPCPIHKGNNPTQFRVSLGKNIWNCFGQCKRGGNVLDFVSMMENVNVYQASLKAIEWFRLDPATMSADTREAADDHQAPPTYTGAASQPEPTSREGAKPAENLERNRALAFRLDKLDRNHPYLAARGLTPETVEEFGIGHCCKGMMAGRIAIPIQNAEGDVLAYAGRWTGEPPEGTPKYKLPQGFRKSLELFNIHRALREPTDTPLVIVEGFFDAMKLYQHGCRKVVALMGSTMSQAQEDLIRQHTERASRIIVMLDEDEAGRLGRQDMAIRLSRFAFVHAHSFDQEGKQPDHLVNEEVMTVLT